MQRPDPSSIPLTPGVYLYKDSRGHIIYVGKARILRRRVLSYFRPEGLPAKTTAMLAHAQSLEFLTTTTEKEALLLESSLIKKHRPHYNIVLRDDKQYVLFRLNIKNPFPRLEIVRRARRDGARYFGPFTSALSARETWKLIHRAFALRRCSDHAMKNRVRPCLYHHMGQCPAPCMGLVDSTEYHKAVHKVCELLQGRSEPLLQSLRAEMEQAAEALEFEKAAALRDQIRAVERTVERQAAVLPGGGDMDAVGLFPAEKGLALGVAFVRSGAVTDGRAFYWPGLSFEDAPELLNTFVCQFYSMATPPPRILLPWIPPDMEWEDAGEEEAPFRAEEETAEARPAAGSSGDAAETAQPAADRAGAEAGKGAVPGALHGAAQGPLAGAVQGPEWEPERLPGQRTVQATEQATEQATVPPATQAAVQGTAQTGGVSEEGAAPAQTQTAGAASPAGGAAAATAEGKALLEQALADRRGGPVRIVAPQNAADNQLIDIAQSNAREEARRREKQDGPSILERVGKALHLPGPPQRIECVDVSHTGGQQTRVGMVVFVDGQPSRPDYRTYAMPDSGDDYATLYAWVARRLESGPPWPDLLLIDGGRGQISVVERALTEAGQGSLFPLAGIAKARDEHGQADRRAGNVADRIFLPGRSNPLPLREGGPELLFLQHIRDNTHRFAIGRHRRARQGAALAGELMRLPGIGPATARLLWEKFGNVEQMRAASIEDLRTLPGIGAARAALLKEKLAKLS